MSTPVPTVTGQVYPQSNPDYTAFTTPGVPISFRRLGVQPPGALLVGVNDILQLSLFSSVTVTVTLTIRILIPTGEITILTQVITLAGTRVGQVVNTNLSDGFLLSTQVNVTGAAGITRGQCYVFGELFRSAQGTVGLNSMVLMQAYVTNTNTVSWPYGYNEPSFSGNGNVRSITGTTPAAGAEISESVPSLAQWRIRSFHYSLVTSATVANRTSRIVIDDGVNILFRGDALGNQAASLTNFYVDGPGLTSHVLVTDTWQAPTPSDLVLRPGWRIRTLTGGLQVGDQYSAPQYEVEEWLTGSAT